MADHPIAKIVPGKGQHYALCVLDFNLDIESGTCSVTLDSEGKSDRNKACGYCYAAYLYKKDPNSYKVKEIKESEFRKIADEYNPERKGVLLRLGKNVECGSTYTRSQLYQVLEYCATYAFRPVITSKLLEFDKKVADLTIASRGIVHISLGRDEDESGAVEQGSTNEWRLAQALLYKQYGCPTQVRIVSDITMPMNDFHKKVFKEMGGSRGILLTPLHYTNRANFESVRQDITWDEAKARGIYTYSHGDMRPNIIHPDWSVTKERCGMINGREYCNNCVGHVDFNKKEYKQTLQDLGWGV